MLFDMGNVDMLSFCFFNSDLWDTRMGKSSFALSFREAVSSPWVFFRFQALSLPGGYGSFPVCSSLKSVAENQLPSHFPLRVLVTP